jgi:hypothetical protein
MKITNEMILLIVFIQFCFLIYQILKISNICNEAFTTESNTELQKQIASFYQADIASIQSLGEVAKALIGGGNLVPGNLTISGNLTAPNIINTPTFTNGIRVPLGQKINLQSNTIDNNNADTISSGTFDVSALCIVGHGSGNGSPIRNIHLWDNVVIDRDLNVKSNLTSNSATITGDFTVNNNITSKSATITNDFAVNGKLNVGGRIKAYTPIIYINNGDVTHNADNYGINQVILFNGPGNLTLPAANSCPGQILFITNWTGGNKYMYYNCNGSSNEIRIDSWRTIMITNDGNCWLGRIG